MQLSTPSLVSSEVSQKNEQCSYLHHTDKKNTRHLNTARYIQTVTLKLKSGNTIYGRVYASACPLIRYIAEHKQLPVY